MKILAIEGYYIILYFVRLLENFPVKFSPSLTKQIFYMMTFTMYRIILLILLSSDVKCKNRKTDASCYKLQH